MRGLPGAAAKTTRPLLAGHFPRKRLFRLIDHVRKRKHLWVSGPAGSGKTTLVSSYIEHRGLPCLWYRLNEEDADPATFFHYLGIAARKVLPRGRTRLPVLTPELLPAIVGFARGYFERLFAGLEEGSAVVFDDFQNLPSKSGSFLILRECLSLLPPGTGVILIGRGEPPPAFARIRAAQALEVIGWKDLRLTPGETEGVARLRWKGKQGRASAMELHRATDGWAAGLVLLLEKAAPGTAEPLKGVRHRPQEVFDYFAGEILETMEEWMQIFLLRTAFLPRMTARMASRLTGRRRAGQILSFLNRHNYFTEMRMSAEPVYEYHPLFRDFLLSRGEEIFSEKYLYRLRGRAAAILEESGHEEEAAGIYRESSDWDGLSRVLRKQADTMVRQGRTATLSGWLDALPRKFQERDPWLLYWRGVCRLPARPEESTSDFEAAFRRFRARKDEEGMFLAWAGGVESILYGEKSLKALDPYFSTLATLMKVRRTFPSEEVESRVTCAMIKALALRRPPSVDGEAWAERAMEVSRTCRDLPTRFAALINVAYYRFHGGELQATGLLLESLRRMTDEVDLSPLPRLSLCWLEAAVANMSGEHERARHVVAEGLKIAESTGVRLLDFLLMGHGAMCSLHMQDLEAANMFLRRMSSHLPTARPWEEAFFHRIAVWEALHRGDLAKAGFHSERGFSLSEEGGNPWSDSLARLGRAFVSHRMGDPAGASAHLGRARRMGDESGMPFLRFACLLAEAHFALVRSDEENGRESLQEGLRIGREKGYLDTYFWCPGLLEGVAAKALEEGIETEYVRRLIRQNTLVPEGTHAFGDRWPWPIKVYAFGGFRVLREEKPLVFSRKAQQKPLLMLKTLLALGGDAVAEEEVTDILWPHADGDLAQQSFATTLRRLRILLGDEQAVVRREGRISLDRRRCWLDVFAFESLLERIDGAPASPGVGSGRMHSNEIAKQAVSLFKGPFLEGEPAHPWILPMRERLRSKFLRAVRLLGRFLESEGRWDEAASCYRRGLEIDDLAESFYQRLMICHHRMGRTAEAIAVYDRCRRSLSSALGVVPSRETEALARSLRST